MNVDYFSCALIEFLVSQICELIEVKMLVSKTELKCQTKGERPRALFTPQFLYETLVARRAIRHVHGYSYEFIFC